LDVDVRSEAGFPSSSSRKITTLRQTLSRGVFAATAATGILSLSCSAAIADADALGGTKDSGGTLAGNVVQVPIHAPVNICGNTISGIAALNAAFGNNCGNDSRSTASSDEDADTPPPSSGTGETSSPGDDDDDCPTPTPSTTPTATPPPPTRVVEKPRPTTSPTPTRKATPPADEQRQEDPPQLAETGSKTMLATSAASAALLAGGVLTYRRGRAAARR
jgi:hypothetical protein